MALLKNKWIIGIVGFVLLVTIVKFGCKKDTTLKVVVEKTLTRTIVESVDETGKIYPTNEMKISVDAGALIKEIYVHDGDTVAKGQAIAEIEVDGTTMTPGKAASNPMANLQKVMQGGVMNPAAVAQAMQQSQQPATTPTITRTTKTKTIYAPMSGVIQGLFAKKGERLLNTEIAKVITENDWEVQAEIGEVDIVKIKEGNEVDIKIDALPNKDLKGIVSRIANANATMGANIMGGGNDATNYKVFIKINKASMDSVFNKKSNYTLRSGMNATIKIATQQKVDVITIPIKAVTTRYQNEEKNSSETKKAKSEIVVFVYNNGKVSKRIVETGIQDIEYIEILSGLKLGEQIVVEPYEAIEKTLANDMKVKQVTNEELFKK
jgi:HlyD family secretion protein